MKKQFRFVYLLGALATIISSCAKNELVSETKLSANQNKLASGRDGKHDVLGYGYNVLGEYANASAATYSVIDVERLEADYPTRVEWDLSTKKEGSLDAGSDALSYLNKLTTRFSNTIGASLFGMSLFKATITANYSNSDSFSSKYIYSSYNLKIQQKRAKFNASNNLLQSYLDPAFLVDIQHQSPEYIVNRYGTHVLTDIILGAKLSVMYQSQTSKSDKTTASSAGIDLNVKKIFNLNTGYTYDTNDSRENTSQKLHYATIGADPSKSLMGDVIIGNASNPNPTPTVNISAWESTSNVNNSVLIDIAPDGLMPIWTLIADPVKSLAVKNYVIQYLLDNSFKLTPDPVSVFYHSANTDHVYTINKDDYPYAQNGWTGGGTAFYAFTSQVPGTQPVFYFYHPGGLDHAYTINRNDYPYLLNGWQDGGVSFYAYTSQQPNTQAVYYFYHPVYKDHAYTTNKNDFPYLQHGWQDGGVAFYVPLH